MFYNPRRLRRPEERVGSLTNADLPPPARDAAIVRGLRARDERAYAQLFNNYYSAMSRLASSFVRSPEEADDVIQDTWLAVLSGIDRFEGRSSLKTWIFRILVNRARHRGRRESRMIPLSTVADSMSMDELHVRSADLPWRSTAASQPDDMLLARELRSQIDRAIAHLPERQREVVRLRDIEGWSNEEVCNTLRISDSNQRVLLHRGRAGVRKRMTA